MGIKCYLISSLINKIEWNPGFYAEHKTNPLTYSALCSNSERPSLHHLWFHVSAHNEILSPFVIWPSWLKLRNTCGIWISWIQWLLKLWNLRSNICLPFSSSSNQSVALPGSKCWIRLVAGVEQERPSKAVNTEPSACGVSVQAGWLLSFLSPSHSGKEIY